MHELDFIMKKVYWIGMAGLILCGWGFFSYFNRTYYNIKFGYHVDLGPYYKEIAIFVFIIGAMLIGLAIRKYRRDL